MDKNIEMSLLYDIYGKFLTDKQQEIFEEYYLYNLSLREIAANKDISYQAVRDSIKKSEKMLLEFEKKIGMLNVKEKINEIYNVCKKSKQVETREILEILSEDDI